MIEFFAEGCAFEVKMMVIAEFPDTVSGRSIPRETSRNFPFPGVRMSLLCRAFSSPVKWSPFQDLQRRSIVKSHSKSMLQLWYGKLSIRKKYIRALRKGTLVWEDGQVKIPPIAMVGYDERNKPFKGNLSQLRSPRVWFKD